MQSLHIQSAVLLPPAEMQTADLLFLFFIIYLTQSATRKWSAELCEPMHKDRMLYMTSDTAQQ